MKITMRQLGKLIKEEFAKVKKEGIGGEPLWPGELKKLMADASERVDSSVGFEPPGDADIDLFLKVLDALAYLADIDEKFEIFKIFQEEVNEKFPREQAPTVHNVQLGVDSEPAQAE